MSICLQRDTEEMPGNTIKYLVLLESLKLQDYDDRLTEKNSPEQDQKRWKTNLRHLKKCIKDKSNTIAQATIGQLQLPYINEETCLQLIGDDLEEEYIVLLQSALVSIISDTNFDARTTEDLISTKHTNLIIKAFEDFAFVSLHLQLHPILSNQPLFYFSQSGSSKKERNYDLLLVSIEVIHCLLMVKPLCINMDMVLRDYIAAIYSLYIANNKNEWELKPSTDARLQTHLDIIWNDISGVMYFRNNLKLKSIRTIPDPIHEKLHSDLCNRLCSKHGFSTLVSTLYIVQNPNNLDQQKNIFDVIAKIVAFRGHSATFQHTMVLQIFKYVRVCLQKDSMLIYMGAGLLSLRRLCDLSAENVAIVRNQLDELQKPLTAPCDLISGLIVMEHSDLCEWITLLFQLFCTSSIECLPTQLLVSDMPLLLQLYYNLPPEVADLQKRQLTSLITRCLDNRPSSELAVIIEKLYRGTSEDVNNWHNLHERIVICPNGTNSNTMRVQVASSDFKSDFSISLALPELFINADHNVLLYRVFMHLLELLTTLLEEETSEKNMPLLQEEEELLAYLNAKYPTRIEVLLSLNTLVSHAPLRTQIAEHSQEFLSFLLNAIKRRINSSDTITSISTDATENVDHSLLLLLTLAQELLEHAEVAKESLDQDFATSLKHLKRISPNQLIIQRVDALLQLLIDGWKATEPSSNTNAFQMARTLLESSESHLQVYGIQMLLDLLRRRDPATVTNGHVIMALAFNMLKSPESYTFLNCVRLFVTLVGIMEVQVLELLSDEYLNDRSSMDLRLVIGEALLKVSMELGPLTYKYKDVLLNCFLHGARSPVNEFRMSSFANLAQICRILCFQVHHIFEELIHLVECEINANTKGYLPAQRAAILVLSQLLEGIEDLISFGAEMLLPVYRLLKRIESEPIKGDERMRLHAVNGLTILNEKCHQLFFPEQQLQKEIKILNIKKDSTSRKNASKKGLILELN